MKKGIPCNETRHTLKRDKNRIRYRFVTLDGNTPSDCTVSIGDTDPLTGEVLTDMTFFTEYYRMEDHDIYSYWKTLRPPLTPAEKQQREEKKEAILESFRKEYGRFPSASDLHWLTDDFMPDRFTVSIERFQDEEGNPESDKMREFGIPCEDPFGENEPDDIFRLREFAASLSGRMADIYEWLLVKYAGGQARLSLQAIAAKWGISSTQIYKDKDRLIRMIQERISETGDGSLSPFY